MTPAERGYALLLDQFPDLRDRITRPVRMHSMKDCVLGQVYGSFGAGMEALFPLYCGDEEEHPAYSHGLDSLDGESGFQALTEEWERLLGR